MPTNASPSSPSGGRSTGVSSAAPRWKRSASCGSAARAAASSAKRATEKFRATPAWGFERRKKARQAASSRPGRPAKTRSRVLVGAGVAPGGDPTGGAAAGIGAGDGAAAEHGRLLRGLRHRTGRPDVAAAGGADRHLVGAGSGSGAGSGPPARERRGHTVDEAGVAAGGGGVCVASRAAGGRRGLLRRGGRRRRSGPGDRPPRPPPALSPFRARWRR